MPEVRPLRQGFAIVAGVIAAGAVDTAPRARPGALADAPLGPSERSARASDSPPGRLELVVVVVVATAARRAAAAFPAAVPSVPRARVGGAGKGRRAQRE